MLHRLRDAWLGRWGRFVASHPWLTLAACLALSAAGILLTVWRLEIRTERSELVSTELPWNKRYANYKVNYPRWNDVIVCIDGEPGNAEVDDLARRLGEQLRTLPWIAAADAGFNVSDAGPRLFLTAGQATFEQTLSDLRQARRVAAASNPNALIAMVVGELAKGSGDAADLVRLEELITPYVTALNRGEPDFSFLDPRQAGFRPLVTETGSGRLRYLRVHMKSEGEGLGGFAEEVRLLREEIARFMASEPLRPSLEWGVTGIPTIEADETAQSVRDSTKASIIAAVLITLLMLVSYRGLVVPLLAMAGLGIGLAWAFGWIVLSVGHLQVLSVTFCSILMGLGIDYALLFVSRLELIRDEESSIVTATERVFKSVGPGMITGAIVTAAAFASTAPTQFTGMAEMGIIAGGGILLCVVAMLSAFPAALAATGRWKRFIRHRAGGEGAPFARGWLDVFFMRPWVTLAAIAAISAVLLAFAWRVHYDGNVLKLQAPGVESVHWEHRIVEDDATSIWAGLSTPRPEEAAEQTRRFLALEGMVSSVGGMGMLFPPNLEERMAQVAALAAEPVEAPSIASGVDSTLTQLASIRAGLSLQLLRGGVPEPIKARLRRINESITQADAAVREAPAETRERVWARLAASFESSRRSLAEWLSGALESRPPGPQDLPPMLRDVWVGLDGSWLLMAFPAPDPQGRSILDPARLAAFVSALRSADPEVLGPPVQIHESSRVIIRSYLIAAALAIGSILILLYLDFRSISDSLCSLVPITFGYIGAFGAMGIAGESLNFANLIIMPLIFGIGMDASVNILHRWRQEPGGAPPGLSGGTGRGITLAMLTTMIGFGSLLVSDHRGIKSLGFVMLAGIGSALLACYIILPAVLALRRSSTWAQPSVPTPSASLD